MVEFALAIPIVLLLVFGIIEGGRLLFIYSSVAAASREAARYGAGIGDNAANTPFYRDCTGIKNAAKRIGQFAGVNDSNITVQFDTGPGTTLSTNISNCADSAWSAVEVDLGDRIVVGVSVAYHPIVPIIRLPDITIRSKNAHTILKEVTVKGTPEE